jgi:hypothetical protein
MMGLLDKMAVRIIKNGQIKIWGNIRKVRFA